jgi:hypothetical protein
MKEYKNESGQIHRTDGPELNSFYSLDNIPPDNLNFLK